MNNEGSGLQFQAGAAGFTDVRLIDASAMTGKLAFTAAITGDSIAKYITSVDTASSPMADVAGTGNVNFSATAPNNGANFIYTGGTNNDTMVVNVDNAVAASRSSVLSGQSDFTFNVSGGTGNDAITFNMIERQLPWNRSIQWLVVQKLGTTTKCSMPTSPSTAVKATTPSVRLALAT